MSERKIKWTESQSAAIDTDAADITVTASAGTGKTTVLSNRCVRIVSQPSLCGDVSQVLVLTFTDAAAGQMASRISQSLKSQLAEKEIPHVRKQLLMLDSADISTIHSFCKRVITEHFYRLGIDSGFRLIDSDEQMLIKSEVLSETIESAWSDSALSEGMKKLFAGRRIEKGPASFLNSIIDISSFLDTIVTGRSFFERAAVLTDLSGNLLTALKPYFMRQLLRCRDMLRHSLELDIRLSGGFWHQQIEEFLTNSIAPAIEALEKDDLQKCSTIINERGKLRLKNRPKNIDSLISGIIRSPANDAVGKFKSLSDFPGLNPDYDRFSAVGFSVQIRTIIELVKRFDRSYDRVKSELGCLDFSDLEHKMLELLCDGSDFSCASASDVALLMREQYKYIFVDEYQDINPVQQRIIDLLSSGSNIFVVGDFKQSIYSFRGADCSLFIERLKRASSADSRKIRLDLNENFRSVQGILDFVNAIFSRIMTTATAGADYDRRAVLRSAADSEPGEAETAPAVELLLVDESVPDDSDSDGRGSCTDTQVRETAGPSSPALRRRAYLIVKRIKQLIADDNFRIYDKQTGLFRRLEYRDIAILMRSISGKANDYVQILRREGIPVTSASSAGYFATTEISDLLSLLRVIDNPQQDIDLAAVMRGPLSGFSETELAAIKTISDKNLFSSLIDYRRVGTDKDLIEKVQAFLARLDQWRTLSVAGSLSDFLWRIFRETGYLSFVSSLPGGSQRRVNLLKLHQRAIQFEGFATSSQTISLGRFVNFIEKLLEQGSDWSPAEPDSSADNSVKVMSVHRSKGLEFPVVIIAELNAGFSNRIAAASCLVDAENGIGLDVISPDMSSRFASPSLRLIKDHKIETELAEEMRILYVAMTRSMDKLILTGSVDLRKSAEKVTIAALCSGSTLPDWLCRSAMSHLDWILFAFASDEKIAQALALPIELEKSRNTFFDLDIISARQLESYIETRRRSHRPSDIQESSQSGDDSLLRSIKSSVNFTYPFSGISRIPAKASVTGLSHYTDEFRRIDYSGVFSAGGLSQNRSVSAVIGSAYHLLIQKIDLSVRPDIGTIEETKSALVDAGSISPGIAKRIDSALIQKFFTSEIADIIFNSAVNLMREWPFTIGVPAGRICGEAEGLDGEKVIVQGIIDMVIEMPDGLVIVDFKTDSISAGSVSERAKIYNSQMSYYCFAAAQILGKKVSSAYLYFLRPAVIKRY